MILQEMLMRDTSFDKPDAVFLDELPHQMMKIRNLLIGRGKSVINYKMDTRRVPDLLDTHFTEYFDGERSSTVLGHRHVSRDDSDITRMVDPLTVIGSNADNLLSKCQRIIVQNILAQNSIMSPKNPGVIKDATADIINGQMLLTGTEMALL
jgi:hypothetical protein